AGTRAAGGAEPRSARPLPRPTAPDRRSGGARARRRRAAAGRADRRPLGSPVAASGHPAARGRDPDGVQTTGGAGHHLAVTNRPGLLPRSGIGVDGPYLVIAPPGNPVISLDSRLLDRIELIGRSPSGALAMSAAAAGGAVAGFLSVIPGGLFAGAGLSYVAFERFTEARRRTRSRDLLLALGNLEVALHVADGAAAAKRLADQLAPYTREAPITRPEVYEDARRRLGAQIEGRTGRSRRELERGLLVG